MDVMDEMSVNNNFNELLGITNQETSFPIDMNFVSENDSITDIFLKNSKLPNSNVNINVFKNANSKYELQAFNGIPLNTINEDILNSDDSSLDLTKMAYLNSTAAIPESKVLEVPRVNFQSLDYYPNVNDFTEEYYPSVNNHYNNIYSIPKYRKLSNSYENVDFNINMLLENDEMDAIAKNLINPELLMNNDNNNYLPSLISSPVPSQNESCQFTNPVISSESLIKDELMTSSTATDNITDTTTEPFHFNLPFNSNVMPPFHFSPNFNNNTTNIYSTTNSLPFQNNVPQLISSPLSPAKLLPIKEEATQIGQEINEPTIIPSNEMLETVPSQYQIPSQNYINNNALATTNINPLFNTLQSNYQTKMVSMESICPQMETYDPEIMTTSQSMIMGTTNYQMSDINSSVNPIDNLQTSNGSSSSSLTYVPFTVPSQTMRLSNEDLLDQESLKQRKILTPTRKLNKITNANSNLYADYMKANQNKIEIGTKKEIPSSIINNENKIENENENASLIQNDSQESVSSSVSTELKSMKKHSLESSEKGENLKYYSISTTNKNENLKEIETIENKTVKDEENLKETKDTKKIEEDIITTSFGATVSTKALINGLIANPTSTTTAPTTTITSTNSTTSTKTVTTTKTGKVTKKRKSTKKEKPPKPEFYPCTFIGCGKVFNKPYNLKSHIKIHSSERPYKCQYCKACFARGHDLNRHTRLHTGVKTFECQKCKKRFSRSDALSRHIKVEACLDTNQNKNNKKSQIQTKNA